MKANREGQIKVLFIVRSTLYTNRGGDTIQILNTGKYLEQIGVSCEIHLCTETINYEPFDLIHFFNLIRPSDILFHIRRSRKPYVVSTIFVEYGEFDKRFRKGISGMVFRLLPPGLIEYLKVLGRRVAGGEKIISSEYLWLGHTASVKKIIKGSVLLLPNSNSEYERIRNACHISHPYRVIPNSIDDDLFRDANSSVAKDDQMVLCVGRIEGLKNQLLLIRALNNTPFRLFLIGSAASNQPRYYEQCRREAAENVQFIDNLPQEKLVEYYGKAGVHALPSWFETTGLSSLEAAAMGCAIVITAKGDQREYFGEDAFYCDPSSAQSIRKAVEEAARSGGNQRLKERIFSQYTWKVTAQRTEEAYRFALSKTNNS